MSLLGDRLGRHRSHPIFVSKSLINLAVITDRIKLLLLIADNYAHWASSQFAHAHVCCSSQVGAAAGRAASLFAAKQRLVLMHLWAGCSESPSGPLVSSSGISPQSVSAHSSHSLSGCGLSCATWGDHVLGASGRAGDSGCDEFISSHGVSSTASLWSSADLGRLHMLPLGGHSVASCVLETISPSTTWGPMEHIHTSSCLLNCRTVILTWKVIDRIDISADLTLTQLSLSILIISVAGAVRMPYRSESLGGGVLGVSVPLCVTLCKWFYGFKIILNLLLRQPALTA